MQKTEGFTLGSSLGLTHSKPCKDTYFVWNRTKTQTDKEKMIQAKADCPLCYFKNKFRHDNKNKRS